MEEINIAEILEKYKIGNLSSNCKKILKLYAQFAMLSVDKIEEEDKKIKFSFAKMCDNQKLDPFWQIILSQVYSIEKNYNRINWILIYDELGKNYYKKCRKCNLEENETCPFKVLASLMNIADKEKIHFEQIMEYVLEEKHEIVDVTNDLPILNLDYIALKASEILVKNDFIKIDEIELNQIKYSYLDLETREEEDFIKYILDDKRKESYLNLENIEEELRIDAEYFTQDPYKLAVYVLWYCKKENIDIYSFYAKEEEKMAKQRDLYYYRNIKCIIKGMPYNEEIKEQLIYFVNFIKNNAPNKMRNFRIPINIILYTTDNNIIREVTNFINSVIFYYNYIHNSKITKLSTNTIISDYRIIKKQYLEFREITTKEDEKQSPGILLIPDFGLLKNEKPELRNRVLNILEEEIRNTSRYVITIISGNKDIINEILLENQSLKYLFNICFNFKDLDEKEVFEIVSKEVERFRKS